MTSHRHEDWPNGVLRDTPSLLLMMHKLTDVHSLYKSTLMKHVTIPLLRHTPLPPTPIPEHYSPPLEENKGSGEQASNLTTLRQPSQQCGQGSIPRVGVISGLSLLVLQLLRFSPLHKNQYLIWFDLISLVSPISARRFYLPMGNPQESMD